MNNRNNGISNHCSIDRAIVKKIKFVLKKVMVKPKHVHRIYFFNVFTVLNVFI